MPSLSGNYVVPKAFVMLTSLGMGTGAVYFFYQLYTVSKQLKRLNCQMTILTDRLLRVEADVIHLRKDTEDTAIVSDDPDDEFVDAEEEDKENLLVNGSVPNSHPVESLEDLLHNIDIKTEEGGLKNLSYTFKRLSELSKLHPKDAEIFWRISRAAYLLAEEEMLPVEGPEEKQKELKFQAREYSEKAVKLNPKSGNAHKWFAIVIGGQTQYMPVQEQIKSAFVIKSMVSASPAGFTKFALMLCRLFGPGMPAPMDHIETAIHYRPKDALLHHMMGRWCYSVYMLSWVERKLASALFATPPTATLEDAMECFQKAESIDPLSSIPNQLYLAKSFIAKGDYKTAVKHMRTGEELKCSTSDDRKSQEEIKKLLQQYMSYAS